MSNSSMSHKKAIESPTIPIVIIIVCLALSFVDMYLLSTALEKLLDFSQSSASLLALFLALVGAGSAFLWGRSEATNKKLKPYLSHNFWIWLLICLVFIAIRIAVVMIDVTEYPDDAMATITSESLMAVLLTILYVGTGLVLHSEARKVFDPERFLEWKDLNAAKSLQNSIARKYAEAERIIIELESFRKYYGSLEKQYVIHKQSLEDAERSTLSTVVKQVLEDNPHLSPQDVEDILQSIIAERKSRIL